MDLAEKLENFSHGVHGAAEPQPNARPDFARLRRGQPILYFTPRPGAPKRSDGGLVLVVVLVLE